MGIDFLRGATAFVNFVQDTDIPILKEAGDFTQSSDQSPVAFTKCIFGAGYKYTLGGIERTLGRGAAQVMGHSSPTLLSGKQESFTEQYRKEGFWGGVGMALDPLALAGEIGIASKASKFLTKGGGAADKTSDAIEGANSTGKLTTAVSKGKALPKTQALLNQGKDPLTLELKGIDGHGIFMTVPDDMAPYMKDAARYLGKDPYGNNVNLGSASKSLNNGMDEVSSTQFTKYSQDARSALARVQGDMRKVATFLKNHPPKATDNDMSSTVIIHPKVGFHQLTNREAALFKEFPPNDKAYFGQIDAVKATNRSTPGAIHPVSLGDIASESKSVNNAVHLLDMMKP